MSITDYTSGNFGSMLHKLRMKKGVPLRKVAAYLDIDASTLVKFEKNKRRPSKKIVEQIAQYFQADAQKLLINVYSDRLENELKNETLRYEILEATKQKLQSSENTNESKTKNR
jgi:transcriptional regulator with XRE-family HTH domain